MKKKAFVIMPFADDTANTVYEICTKPICAEFDLKIERADEIFTVNPILDDIIAAIEKAAVIIADISGKNQNVFYELGMSHMLKRKQTIMITQDEFEGIPFDISHFRIIQYKNTMVGKTNYEGQLRETLRNILFDYKLIYKDDYDMLIDFLSDTNEGDFYHLIALAKSPKPLHKHEVLNIEGHNKETGSKYTVETYVGFGIKNFIYQGFAEVPGDLVILTDKGRAFVEVLEERGFICDYVNGNILSDGYIPNAEKKNVEGITHE